MGFDGGDPLGRRSIALGDLAHGQASSDPIEAQIVACDLSSVAGVHSGYHQGVDGARQRSSGQIPVKKRPEIVELDGQGQASPTWSVPGRVQLDGDAIAWSWAPARAVIANPADRVTAIADFGRARPDGGMLMRFASLADASDNAIADFARRWGVLRLCAAHDLPDTHPVGMGRDGRVRFPVDPTAIPCAMSGFRPLTMIVRERLDLWRSYAREVWAVLHVTHRLGVEESPDRAAAELLGMDPRVRGAGARQMRQQAVARVVDAWLALGGVRPMLVARGGPHLVLGSTSGLHGGIAAALALHVSRGDRVMPCSEPDCPAAAVATHPDGRRIRSDARPFCQDHLDARHVYNSRVSYHRTHKRAHA